MRKLGRGISPAGQNGIRVRRPRGVFDFPLDADAHFAAFIFTHWYAERVQALGDECIEAIQASVQDLADFLAFCRTDLPPYFRQERREIQHQAGIEFFRPPARVPILFWRFCRSCSVSLPSKGKAIVD